MPSCVPWAVPLDELGPMIAEDHAKLEALSAGLSAAFRYAGWRELNGRVDACADIMVRAYQAEGLPVPEALGARAPRQLHVIRDGDQ